MKLSGWPCKSSAGEDVNVQMEDTLPSVFPRVDDGAIAVADAQLFGHFRHGHQQMPDQRGIFRRQVVERFNRLSGYQQHMNWCLRADIPKRQTVFVFVDDVGRNFAIDNLSEDGQTQSSRDSVFGDDVRSRRGGETEYRSKISSWSGKLQRSIGGTEKPLLAKGEPCTSVPGF